MHVDAAVESVVCGAEDPLYQLFPAERTARFCHKRREQTELRGCQREWCSIEPGLVAVEVKLHTIRRKMPICGLRSTGRSSEHGLDSRSKFTRTEGLCQIVVCAGVQSPEPVFFGTACSEHNDEGIADCADTSADFQPVHAQEHNVEDN